MQILKFTKNFLVLAALTGAVLFGWLAGHILRHSIPEFQFQHPPIPESGPKIKNGLEFEGQRIVAAIDEPWVRVYIDEIPVNQMEVCEGNTYYTSLPAKCRSADGKLVRVERAYLERLIIPQSK